MHRTRAQSMVACAMKTFGSMIWLRKSTLAAISLALAGVTRPAVVLAGDVHSPGKIRVACIGDSTTFGIGVKNKAEESYPAQLQTLLGGGYQVTNLGVGSCTLIRKGSPNVWTTLKRLKASQFNPDIVVVDLGINDTVGSPRNCWSHQVDFPGDYRDLVDALAALPSKPRIWLCAPSPMVLETPGLNQERRKNLAERQPRLQELISVIKRIATEKHTGFIDLNTPLADKPQFFKDGVHMKKDGYHAVAELVAKVLKKSDDAHNNSAGNATSNK